MVARRPVYFQQQNNYMKTFLTRFFVTLGVTFFLLLCAGAYVWFTDTYGVRTLVTFLRGGVAEVELVEDGVDRHPAMNEQQEAALEAVGIDPASVPSSITPAQEACFTEALGAARVEAIKGGDSPTAAEILQAGKCLE